MKMSKKSKIFLMVTMLVVLGAVIFGIAGGDGAAKKKIVLYYLNSDKTTFEEYEKSFEADT